MKIIGLQTHIWKNNFRSLFLLIMFPIMMLVIGLLITYALSFASMGDPITALYGSVGMMAEFFWIILSIVALWFIIAWLFHGHMIRAMTHAKPLERHEATQLYDIVETLCISRGAPMPSLYIIEDDSMNAFASGLSPKHAMMTFSRGLLNRLTKDEIEAVAAHELSHILNRDIRVMVISIIFVGILQTIAEIFLRSNIQSDDDNGSSALVVLIIKIVVFVFGYVVAALIQLAISRKREYLADAGAVELTKTSQHLISALEKIDTDSRIEVIENASVAQMCIENPMEKTTHVSIWQKLFSTHPPMSERISVLRQIG